MCFFPAADVMDNKVILMCDAVLKCVWTLRLRTITASQPDVGGAVSAGIPQLVGQNRTVGLFTKIHQEVLIQGQTAVHSVHIDLHHH